MPGIAPEHLHYTQLTNQAFQLYSLEQDEARVGVCNSRNELLVSSLLLRCPTHLWSCEEQPMGKTPKAWWFLPSISLKDETLGIIPVLILPIC